MERDTVQEFEFDDGSSNNDEVDDDEYEYDEEVIEAARSDYESKSTSFNYRVFTLEKVAEKMEQLITEVFIRFVINEYSMQMHRFMI